MRRSIEKLERQELRFQEAVMCYISAIDSVEAHLVPVVKELAYEHRRRLLAISKGLSPNPTPEELRASRASLAQELKDYHDSACQVLEKKDNEIKAILGVIADAVGILTTQNDAHDSRIGEFTKQIETVSRMTSLTEIRCRLVQEVGQLKSWLAESENQKRESLEQLRGELKTFQRRLEKAERLAFTDTLTGVANRAEGEAKLAENIESGRCFSILLFDLNRFKHINDGYGHQVGDLVLKTFSSRLARHVRPSDTVCRWGGDEFLVILVGCNLENALHRAKSLSEICSGVYGISFENKEVTVYVETAVGAAEYWPGETCEELFSRADKFLYREKEVPTLCPARRLSPTPAGSCLPLRSPAEQQAR
ncbi:MAG: diguanylate cyclase [Bryobacteraceae bacterium]|nr:diguanylate cyclase [Bryobacteraceae bacterium]